MQIILSLKKKPSNEKGFLEQKQVTSQTTIPDAIFLEFFFFASEKTSWPSGLRRVTRNHFSVGGVGSNPADVVFWQPSLFVDVDAVASLCVDSHLAFVAHEGWC